MDEHGIWLPVHVTFDLKGIIFRVGTQKPSSRACTIASAMIFTTAVLCSCTTYQHYDPSDAGHEDSCARLYWTNSGLQENIVEEYVSLGALYHVALAPKRSQEHVVELLHAMGKFSCISHDLNGYGFFYAGLYWTEFGLHASIVEENSTWQFLA